MQNARNVQVAAAVRISGMISRTYYRIWWEAFFYDSKPGRDIAGQGGFDSIGHSVMESVHSLRKMSPQLSSPSRRNSAITCALNREDVRLVSQRLKLAARLY